MLDAKLHAPVWSVHAAIDGASHAFADEVAAVAARAPWVERRTFYERPRDEDRRGIDYDIAERVDRATLAKICRDGDIDVYLCGPTAFMREMLALLAEIGVPDDRVHFEFFGPQSSLEDAPPAERLHQFAQG